jgi:hypothetical protein
VTHVINFFHLFLTLADADGAAAAVDSFRLSSYFCMHGGGDECKGCVMMVKIKEIFHSKKMFSEMKLEKIQP